MYHIFIYGCKKCRQETMKQDQFFTLMLRINPSERNFSTAKRKSKFETFTK